MKFHHTACLVRDIDQALNSFAPFICGDVQEPVFVAKQQVTVCLVPLGGGSFLELVCPGPKARGLREMLENGASYYHVAFSVPEIDDKLEELSNLGFEIVASFLSEAFGGALCTFMKTPTGELVELIEELASPDE